VSLTSKAATGKYYVPPCLSLPPIERVEAAKVARKVRQRLARLRWELYGAQPDGEVYLKIVRDEVFLHWGSQLSRQDEKKAFHAVLSELNKLFRSQLKLRFPRARKRDLVT